MVDVPSLPETQLKELYRSYLTDRGILSEPISTKKSSSKTPDFLLEHGDCKILCELKAPEHHFNNEIGLYKHKAKFQKLWDFYRTAVKQFDGHDTERAHPRLLVFMSCHMQLNLHCLQDAIQGGILNQDGASWMADFRATDAYGRFLESLGKIDAILWLQLSAESKAFLLAGYFVQQGSTHVEAVESLFNVLQRRPVGANDQRIAIPPFGDFVRQLKRSDIKGHGRNSQCVCGSGKKFKHCCGALS